MSDGSEAIKSALEAAPAPDTEEREQLSMLAADEAAPEAAARGPGRPKGAKNKRTEYWQRWIAASGKHPMVFLTEQYRRNTQDLAKELDCDPLDALKVQVKAAEAVMPFVEQKLPTAIEDVSDEHKRPLIVVGELSAGQARRADVQLGLRLANGNGKAEEKQDVIDLDPVKSQDE